MIVSFALSLGRSPKPCCTQGLPHLTSFPWGFAEKLARFYFASHPGSVWAKPLPGEVVSKYPRGCNWEARQRPAEQAAADPLLS